MTNSQLAFFVLVRAGIGHGANALPNSTDWESVRVIAVRQGLLAVAFDGLKCLSEEGYVQSLPLTEKLCWLGEVMQGYEQRYQLYKKAIAQLARFYSSQGFRMMLLKGYACCINWPKPDHRPCGDIDIYLFGQQKEADARMAQEFKNLKIDNSRHHHSVFNWQGFTVENHYDFMNVHHHKSNVEIEKVFKTLANDDSNVIQLEGEKVYLPSPNLHALFLLRHAMAHFAAEQITIRHLLDWAFFVKEHTQEVDWGWLERQLDVFGMTPMYGIINAICVEDLGFEAGMFTQAQCDSQMKERVLSEILSPEFSPSLPKRMDHRVVYKYRRWKGNEWKHKLCYNDSMRSSLWAGIWNHLLKPSTI